MAPGLEDKAALVGPAGARERACSGQRVPVPTWRDRRGASPYAA